jgi:hypothetical protein
MSVQLDFWKSDEECEIDSLRLQVRGIHTSTEKVRKCLFARNNEIEKLVRDLSTRLEIIERNICRG